MKRLYISQSAINDFISCKKRYYYRLYYKDESIPTKEMFLGTLVHRILENYTDNQEEAMDQVERYVGEHDLTSKDRDVLVGSVEGFYNSFQHLITPDDVKEKMFTLPYAREIFITGKFDRITPNHMVIDWKSGGYVPLTLANDIQSILYSYAYEKLYGVVPTVVVAYLRKNKLSYYLKDDFYSDILFNEIIPDLINSVDSGEFSHTGYFNNACRNCSFKAFCDKEAGR